MRRPGVLNVALVCGIGAFCWTLIRGAPSDEQPDPDVQERTAQAAGQLAWPPRTLEQWEEIVRADENDYWGWLNVAERRAWAEKDAEDAWRAVLKTGGMRDDESRDYGRARYAMGVAASALGMEGEAREYFTLARAWYTERVTPQGRSDRPELWSRLAWICQHLGEVESAQEYWEKAADRAGKEAQHSAQAAYNLACYLALLARPDEAIRVLNHAARLGYDDAELAAHDDDLASVRKHVDFPLIIGKMRENTGAETDAHRGPY